MEQNVSGVGVCVSVNWDTLNSPEVGWIKETLYLDIIWSAQMKVYAKLAFRRCSVSMQHVAQVGCGHTVQYCTVQC